MSIIRTVQGIFSRDNQRLLGTTFVTNPLSPPAGDKVNFQTVGQAIAMRAPEQWDNQHAIVTCSSYPLKSLTASLAQQNIQMVMSFQSGNSLFGSAQEPLPPPAFLPPPVPLVSRLSSEIVVDCASAVVSLPTASSLEIKFRQTTVCGYYGGGPMKEAPFGFAEPISPYRVNVGFSYGTPKSIQSWYTDIPYYMIPTREVMWAKPQFAEALTLTSYGSGSNLFGNPNLTGLIYLIFLNLNNVVVKQSVYTAPFNMMPLIQWPQDAWYVMIANETNMDLMIGPVHAIRL